MERLACRVAEPLVDALREIENVAPGTILMVASDASTEDWAGVSMTIDIPGDRLRKEWIDPMKRIRQTLVSVS